MISAIPGMRCPSSSSVNVPFPVSMMCSWSALSAMRGTLRGAETGSGTAGWPVEPTRVAPRDLVAAPPPRDQHRGAHESEGTDDRTDEHGAVGDEHDRQRQAERDQPDAQPPEWGQGTRTGHPPVLPRPARPCGAP